MRRARFGMGAVVILVGLAYLVLAGFQQSQATHMTVSQLMARTATESLGDLRIQLAGNVVHGSIEWDEYHHRAQFLVVEGGQQVKVDYTGSAVLPDTFKDDSPVVLEGRYRADATMFEAEVVMAKCPSKYEGQNYDGHLDGTTSTP